jgi:hypothetical protein
MTLEIPLNTKLLPISCLYAITNDGQLFSKAKLNKVWRKMKRQKDNKGYYYYDLHLERGKKGKKYKEHRLVAMTYLPDYTDDCFVCHKDNNSTNNNIFNLYCGNAQTNSDDKRKSGTIIKGIKVNTNKLTERQVKEIFNTQGNTSKIAIMYNVSTSTIKRIRNKTIWKHIHI